MVGMGFRRIALAQGLLDRNAPDTSFDRNRLRAELPRDISRLAPPPAIRVVKYHGTPYTGMNDTLAARLSVNNRQG